MPERKHFPSINIFASIGFEMFAMGRTKNNVIYECDWKIQVITIITYLPKIISVWNAVIISKVCLGLFSLQWSTIVPQCSYFKAREWFILQLEICFGCGAFQCNQMIFGTVFLYSRFLKYVFIYLFFFCLVLRVFELRFQRGHLQLLKIQRSYFLFSGEMGEGGTSCNAKGHFVVRVKRYLPRSSSSAVKNEPNQSKRERERERTIWPASNWMMAQFSAR